jgi:hypothetical protein
MLFVYVLLFIFFAVAVTFGVLFALKKTSVDSLKDDMTSLLSSISDGKTMLITPATASCLTGKISTSLDNDPIKMGVVLGDLCAFATAMSLTDPASLNEPRIPSVCTKYNGGINKTTLPQMISSCKGA